MGLELVRTPVPAELAVRFATDQLPELVVDLEQPAAAARLTDALLFHDEPGGLKGDRVYHGAGRRCSSGSHCAFQSARTLPFRSSLSAVSLPAST